MAGRVGFWGGEGSKKYGIHRVPYKNRCLSGSKVRSVPTNQRTPFLLPYCSITGLGNL